MKVTLTAITLGLAFIILANAASEIPGELVLKKVVPWAVSWIACGLLTIFLMKKADQASLAKGEARDIYWLKNRGRAYGLLTVALGPVSLLMAGTPAAWSWRKLTKAA